MKKEKVDVYQIVTDRILTMLEKGVDALATGSASENEEDVSTPDQEIRIPNKLKSRL